MPEKLTPSYIMAVIGAALYVYAAQKEMPFWQRVIKVASSACIGVAVGPELAEKFGTGPNLTVIATITLAWVVVEALTTFVLKHADLLDLIRKVTGK